MQGHEARVFIYPCILIFAGYIGVHGDDVNLAGKRIQDIYLTGITVAKKTIPTE